MTHQDPNINETFDLVASDMDIGTNVIAMTRSGVSEVEKRWFWSGRWGLLMPCSASAALGIVALIITRALGDADL